MTIRTLSVMSPQDIRNLYLRALRCELIARGVPNPNVSPKSDYAVRAAALAQILAPCMANAVAAAEINMPDTCTGERLERWLAVYGLSKRPAKGSSGNVEYASEASSYVAVGQRLVDDQGHFYEVKTAATYANGALIPIEAISTGASTNRVAGTVLQWVTPPTYAKPKAKVATGGLADGADADKEEIARARLLSRMAYSAGGGNWAQTVAWAESQIAGTSAYDYPALNGPGTYGLWVLGQPRWTGEQFSRQISDEARAAIASFVRNQKPAEVFLTMPVLGNRLLAFDQPGDVSLALALPFAVGAGGAGGGWTDVSPWPILKGSATFVRVASVTDSTHITVTSDDPATTPDPAGIVDSTTQIAWFDPSSYGGNVIKTSTIVRHYGSVGNVTLVLDPAHPLTGITALDWIFPNCEHAETYAQAWLKAMSEMGPGEWSADPTVLKNSRRKPNATTTAPHTLSYAQRKAIEQSSPEVLDASYLFRPPEATAIPLSTKTDPPYVMVPGRRLAFYLPK